MNVRLALSACLMVAALSGCSDSGNLTPAPAPGPAPTPGVSKIDIDGEFTKYEFKNSIGEHCTVVSEVRAVAIHCSGRS